MYGQPHTSQELREQYWNPLPTHGHPWLGPKQTSTAQQRPQTQTQTQKLKELKLPHPCPKYATQSIGHWHLAHLPSVSPPLKLIPVEQLEALAPPLWFGHSVGLI